MTTDTGATSASASALAGRNGAPSTGSVATSADHDVVARHCPWVRRHPHRSTAQRRRHDRLARLRDLVLVLVLAPLWAPLTAAVAAAIWLDSPGAPILFRQQRTGRDGKRFEVLKFRTMVPDAEERKKDLLHLNELVWPDFKITNDPRITGIGRLLRATGLDELPQLFTVLRGQMGLVGPRPTSFAADTYDLWHTERLDARPGLTGLWQTAGRAETEWDDRLRIELAYIRRRSLWLDTVIMVRTVPALLRAEGK